MTNRAGLYFMVGLGVVASLQSCELSRKNNRILRGIEQKLGVIEENVLGEKTLDKFYQVDGRRIYVEIDGASPETYFKEHPQEGR